MATALVHDGGRVLLEDGAIHLGRGRDCDIVIDDPSVSRRHARLAWRGDRGTLFDLDSPNGVFRNGKRIVRSALVGPGDSLRLGDYELTLQALSQAPARDDDIIDDFSTEDDREDEVTVVANSVALTVAIASRLLDGGKTDDAEKSLSNSWDALSTRAHAVHPALTVLGARTGLRMAAATKNPKWADESAMMLASVDQAPDLETLQDITKTVATVGMTSTVRTYLEKYGDSVNDDEAARTTLAALLKDE